MFQIRCNLFIGLGYSARIANNEFFKIAFAAIVWCQFYAKFPRINWQVRESSTVQVEQSANWLAASWFVDES